MLPLAAMALLIAPPTQADYEREIRARWRAHASDVEGVGRDFRGAIDGASLGELGRLAFVFHEAGIRRWSRRNLDPQDRDFATRAALSQTPEEFDRNVPAIVGFLRLSAELEDHGRFFRRQQQRGRAFSGLGELQALSARLGAFRARQQAAVREGRLDAAYALTLESVGELADPALRTRLLAAYRQSVRQGWRKDGIALLWLLLLVVAVGAVTSAALRHRRRTKPDFQVGWLAPNDL